MLVLGIDPGTASTGFGVVERRSDRTIALDGGVIETAAHDEPAHRLAQIHGRVAALIDEYHPAALAIESLYFGANVRSAFAVGEARGAVLVAAGQRAVACHGYTPQQIKGAVCGSGRAGKAQVQRMVGVLLSLDEPPSPDHAADALAVALCHLNCAPRLAAVAMAR